MAAVERGPTDDRLLGRRIAGKFTLEARVGSGGMGAVYRARQAGLDKVVAIKVLHRELLAEPTFATRFKREATSASRIDHPSSLRIIDFGEEPDGLLYIAMEYLEGRTLFQVLREEAPLAPSRIVDLSRQILAALAAAHELGIVHRDLKPENIVVLSGKDDDGRVTEPIKVCDFGVAKRQARSTDEKLTMEGSIVGTPEYLSPEQARGEALDARSDLYSMGVILFEMMTGEPPFRGETPLATVLKHLDVPAPRPSILTPTVDPRIEAVCLKAMSKSPADRFGSAREMRTALRIDSHASVTPPTFVAAPAVGRRVVVMAETPPPVTSSQPPLPLVPRSSSSRGSQRPRLSDMEGPPSNSSRALAAVMAAALLGGSAGAYWWRNRATERRPSVHVAAHNHVPPSAFQPRRTEPPAGREPAPSTATATSASNGSTDEVATSRSLITNGHVPSPGHAGGPAKVVKLAASAASPTRASTPVVPESGAAADAQVKTEASAGVATPVATP